MIVVPLPRLLDSSGQTAGFVRPIRESITLNKTPLSYATMELPVGESLPARSFVELNTAIGTAGVFRVRAPQEAYGEDVTLVELEHAIVEVGDWLILENLEGTFAAGTAMQRVFSHYRGTHWQLGSVSALTGNVDLKAGYSRILDVMLDIVARCDGCMLTFDFSSHPWTVSVVQKGSAVAAEGRLSRNISSARISYDDTDLCTRAYYPIPSTNAETGEVTHTWGSVDADTISTYGVAEKAVFDENDTTAAECLATAQKYLEKYKRPKFSIQITGEELAARTGESLDSFEVGKLFRLALADYNVTVEENITVLSWEDVYGSPTAVNITLAEEETDTVSYIHDLDVSGSTVSSGSTKDVDGKVTTIYSSRTVNNEVDLVKIKADAAGNILAQAGMSIDPETGVLIYADDFEQNIGAKFNVQANKIGMVVGTYQGQNYIKAGEIALAINDADESVAHIDANHVNISATDTLHTLAGAIEEDDQGNVTIKSAGGMRVRKTVSGQVAEFGVFDENSLTAGVIVDRVNGGSVTIKGSKVWVGDAATDQTLKKWATESDGLFAQNIGALSARIGTIEADYVTADEIDANYITTRLAQASSVSVALLNTSGAAIFGGGTYATNGLWVEGTRLTIGDGNPVQSVTGASVTGGGYKLTVTQADGSSHDITFNTASSLTFSGAWAGASYTATAKDADDNVLGSVTTAISRDWGGGTTLSIKSGTQTLLSEAFTAGTGTGASTQGTVYNISTFNSSHKAYAYVDATSHPAGRLFSFNVDATSEYNAGSAEGYTSGHTAGYAEGRTDYRPGSITQDTANKQITVLNDAGDSLATYSVLTTYNAGVTAGEAKFSRAALTLQGEKETIVPIGAATKYASVKRYKGDGGGYYGRGVAVSAYIKTGNTYTPKTLYAGDGVYHYDRGHEETVLVASDSGSLVRYAAGTAITRYTAGTSYTTSNSPYYTKTT